MTRKEYNKEYGRKNRKRLSEYQRKRRQKYPRKRRCEHNSAREYCLVCSPSSWAKRILWELQNQARKRSHADPVISPEEILKLRNEMQNCYLCGAPLINESRPTLHHSHETGEVFGYTHNKCNSIEGFFKSLPEKSRKVLLEKLREIS